MSNFSNAWKGSSKPRKQRKYKIAAPLHIRQKFIHAHLSKDLRKKYGKRSVGMRKGDKVMVIAGKFTKHEGKIEEINLKEANVFVNGIETTKRDGTKKMLAMHPSNVMIIELNLDDKLRQKILERK
ncbi:50S ribosomal protein L24 [Candidatus Woesearchaeota archaeon]|nr:50S ribosomal protein L24 [Candidatus Woesearchaeota archaeon]